MIHNYIALGFLFFCGGFWAHHGGIYATVSSPCCTWINETGQVEQALHWPKYKAKYVSSTGPHSLLFVLLV